MADVPYTSVDLASQIDNSDRPPIVNNTESKIDEVITLLKEQKQVLSEITNRMLLYFILIITEIIIFHS